MRVHNRHCQKKALRKRERRERKAAQWKQERKKRRTARKKRHVVGDGEGDFGSNVLVVNEGAEMTVEQKREMREARKAVEIADFMARSEKGTTVVLDLEWEDKLSDREVKALVQQVLYCYGSNRSALRPVRLVLSGVKPGSHTLERLQKLAGFPKSWQGVTILEQRYIDHFDSDRDRHRLVYLTADTDTVVRTFEPEKVYIIGGIVDHNRLKGSTRAKADEQRIASGRLPLEDHMEFGSKSRVLTVNHVLNIILEHQRSLDWRVALEACIPAGKARPRPSERTAAEDAPRTAARTAAAAPAAAAAAAAEAEAKDEAIRPAVAEAPDAGSGMVVPATDAGEGRAGCGSREASV